jgi:uncharacterized membrane protein YuzA (DUF378 family)
MRMNAADWLAMVLVIVGGLNWGLVGAFDFNLVTAILGEGSMLARIVFILVGLSAVYLVFTASKMASTDHHISEARA